MDIEMFVKGFILPSFAEGKDLEVRVKSRFVSSIRVGDILIFNNSIRRRVKAMRGYSDFHNMLQHENYKRLYPRASSKDWLLNALRSIYPRDREEAGVVVFELEEIQ